MNSFKITESTFVYLQKPFKNLDISKFDIDIVINEGFEVLFAYSYDNQNFSQFMLQSEFHEILDDSEELYVCIFFDRKIPTDININSEQKIHQGYYDESLYTIAGTKLENVDSKQQYIIVKLISYNSEILKYDDFKFVETYKLINEFPKWNFYDNQQITINRWLAQCNSIAEMYGHTCIYFKTEPIDASLSSITPGHPDKGILPDAQQSGIHGIHHTLAVNTIRKIISVKKLHIMFPNNELPQDRTIYSDWDMPLQDDFLIHIVRQKFEQAFGLKAIPDDKDFIYLPIINKLYRVSTFQPKNGFMGVIGWWEVFLAKYEDDDSVVVSKSMRDEFSNIFDGIDEILVDTTLDKEKINQETVEEKKFATNNFTNVLDDTTRYVSLKETETLREFYDKRLEIVSVNPDDGLYPITMYNCSKIERRNIALKYSLNNYIQTNKFPINLKNNYSLIFNFSQLGRHTGEVFEIISNENILMSLKSEKQKFKILDIINQQEILIDYQLELNELYQIVLHYDLTAKIYAIKIFTLKDKQKTFAYQNIYRIDDILKIDTNLTNLYLYGGKYLVNDIILEINNNKILEDNCLPLLETFKF